jgi:hypothetical protein
MTEQDIVRSQAMAIYGEGVRPTSIPTETALEIGRLLFSKGYRPINSYLVASDSELTVNDMLVEFDDQTRYIQSIREVLENKGGIIGPYYTTSDGEEFCPNGIAVWLPEV